MVSLHGVYILRRHRADRDCDAIDNIITKLPKSNQSLMQARSEPRLLFSLWKVLWKYIFIVEMFIYLSIS